MSERFLFRVIFASCVVLASALSVSSLCQAMNVQPSVIDMSVTGSGTRSTIQVTNDSTKALPVDFDIQKLELGNKGERSYKSASSEFLVFPPQAIIQPGATQVFRLQWVGEPTLSKSKSYIFSVNQAPVKLKKDASGVQVVFNFEVVVNVAPVDGHAVLKQVKSEISLDDQGSRRPTISVENPGTMHAYLSDATINLQSGNWHQIVPASQLKQLIGLGIVQPGKQRRFVIPVDVPASVSAISASIDYKPKASK